MTNTSKIIQRNMPTPPIVIPQDLNAPLPFLLRFAKRPEIKIPNTRMGNPTYMGTTSCQGGEVGDFENDDV